MGNFDRNNNSGGGRFGRRDFGGDRNRERPEMHSAICSSCGKECQLPFRPSGDRPVYCSDCFAKTNGAEPRRNFDRNDRRDDRGGSRPPFRKFDNDTSGKSLRKLQFEALDAKLDKILNLLSANNNTVVAKPVVVPAPKKKSEPKIKPVVETVEPVAVIEPETVTVEPEVITEVVAKKKKVAKKV